MKIPNAKPQAPKKFQIPNLKNRGRNVCLEFGAWSFFGIWSLELLDDRATRPALCAKPDNAARNRFVERRASLVNPIESFAHGMKTRLLNGAVAAVYDRRNVLLSAPKDKEVRRS